MGIERETRRLPAWRLGSKGELEYGLPRKVGSINSEEEKESQEKKTRSSKDTKRLASCAILVGVEGAWRGKI